jgi:Mlc titration factor MtfA (ptsG expression regulator)
MWIPKVLSAQKVDGGSIILVVVVVIITVILLKRKRYNDQRYHRFKPARADQNDFSLSYFSFFTTMPPSGIKILADNFDFFRQLNARKQKKFSSRVMNFISDKNFIGRDNLSVSFEMKVLIAATAIRVTWGLRTYMFPTFHTILIYPKKFYSAFSKAIIKGETNMAGLVVFSWEDFLFGVSDQNDNLNLGYHEFGHALFVERFKETMDVKFMNKYDQWRRLVISMNKLKEAELKKTFREYATFNEHEFFAVAVENFFERPEKFNSDLPRLYGLMVKMLNQDPLASVRRFP